MKRCHACKQNLSIGRLIGRKEECPFCHADLHCCLNCTFYEPSRPKQCHEPIAEFVKEKNRSNYCDYFSFADSVFNGDREKEAEKSRQALNNLFKK